VIADTAKRDVEADYEYLLQRCKEYLEHHHMAIRILVNSTALRRNEKQIRLAKQVTKLTVLATVFLPLSFCTSIFGMNFNELNI
jgi:Mg2+ and Co2+ transporter CorA